ncbi:MAG: flavodoxin family protein [Chloroflexi bacterium]|nr:flavodoxin family protein [Chloroflexota bacterium]
MKVLGIMCSPRRGGNTEILLQTALDSAREAGAEVEMLRVAGMKIAPCDGCLSCETTGVCHIKDDMQVVSDKMLEADAIVLGSPVYWFGVSAQAKIVIDRTYALYVNDKKLKNKVTGCVVTAIRSGCHGAIEQMNSFFLCHRTNPVYWATGYGDNKGDVKKDEDGLSGARRLGQSVVDALKLRAPRTTAAS